MIPIHSAVAGPVRLAAAAQAQVPNQGFDGAWGSGFMKPHRSLRP